MDASTWILVALTVIALGVAIARGPETPVAALRNTGRLVRGVWLELCLGFLLAGLFDTLVSAETLARWLGREAGSRGILVGWVSGLIIPGGPYVLFPIVANLFRKGAGAGALITLVSAKTLVSPIRMLTYEAPLVGWPLTLARLIPGVLVPPLLGVAGELLFRWLGGRGR
jgi:uncharacterized membrane protein YraQ (UPF0718 family)